MIFDGPSFAGYSMRFVGFVAMPMLQSSRWQMLASYFCGFQWRKTPIGSWAALPLDPGSGSKPWLEVIAKRMRDNSKSKDILSISKSKRTQRNRTIRTSLSSLRAFLVEIASVLQDLFGQDLSEQTPTTRNKTGQEKRTTRSLTTRSMRIWPPRHRKSFLKKWIKNWASTDVALWFWAGGPWRKHFLLNVECLSRSLKICLVAKSWKSDTVWPSRMSPGLWQANPVICLYLQWWRPKLKLGRNLRIAQMVSSSD